MGHDSCCQTEFPILSVLRRMPDAVADVRGSEEYPCITGRVRLYQTNYGVIVYSEIKGLPDAENTHQIFGFHIHEGSACEGDRMDPFADALSHYNPDRQNHPYHAGDLPPLFGNQGYALSLVLTERFCLREVIGRVLIIHDHPDDFMTQPSGNAGTKIACGVIRKIQSNM